MTAFTYLFLGHLVGDFLLQTSWMAKNKAKDWSALLAHCTVYTITVIAFSLWGGIPLSFYAIVLLFFSHVFLDRRTFNVWWNRTIMRNEDQKWLHIVTDQVLHLLVLGVILHYGI